MPSTAMPATIKSSTIALLFLICLSIVIPSIRNMDAAPRFQSRTRWLESHLQHGKPGYKTKPACRIAMVKQNRNVGPQRVRLILFRKTTLNDFLQDR